MVILILPKLECLKERKQSGKSFRFQTNQQTQNMKNLDHSIQKPVSFSKPQSLSNWLIITILSFASFNSYSQCYSYYVSGLTIEENWKTTPTAGRGYKPYWSFTGVAGRTYSFSDCYGEPGQYTEETHIMILDNTMQVIAYIDDNTYCTGNSASGDWLCPANGNYYVVLAHWWCDMLLIPHALTHRVRLVANWTGAVSTDWNNGDNWSTGLIPTAQTYVIIPSLPVNQPHITSGTDLPALCKDLTIRDGAALTVETGKALTVIGNLTNEAGINGLVIENSGSLMHNSNGVQATIKRTVSGNSQLDQSCYHLVSVPLAQSSNPTANLFNGSYLYYLNPNEANAGNGSIYGLWASVGENAATPLQSNKGYMLYYPNNAGHTYTFEGELNNGEFASSVVGHAGNYTWNLIPNPYPSTLDWIGAGWSRSAGVGGAYYVWSATEKQYLYCNIVGLGTTTRYIPVGQSVMVAVWDNPVPSILVNNDARLHYNQAFNKSSENFENLLNIKASINGLKDEAFVWFNAEGTAEVDLKQDALKLFGAAEAPQLYTLSGDTKLSINELPVPENQTTLTMAFETQTSGKVTLNTFGSESFGSNVSLFLKDELAGNTINLKDQNTYTFEHNPVNQPNRFKLIFNSTTGIDDEFGAKDRIWFSENHLHIAVHQPTSQPATIEVYNATGRQILKKSVLLSSQTSMDLNASGFVIARVTVNGSVLVANGILMEK